MYTVIDYLNYYKDTTLKYVKLNQIDFLIFSCFSYFPIDSINKPIKMKEFYKKAKEVEDKKKGSITTSLAYQLLEIAVNSKRYQSLMITNFTNIKDETTQFCAVTFKLGKNTIISYKGTDNSLIGWIENIRATYLYPTNTQKKAIKYLEDNILLSNDNIYLTGHSKGGNLAIVSAMEVDLNLQKKIKHIYNFDGPGLNKEQYNSDNYKKIKSKLTNIIPSSSIIGTLFYNDNYSIIMSNKIGFECHYPTSWCIFGQFFRGDSLKVLSSQLHEYTTTSLDNIDKKEIENTMEELFKTFKGNYTKNFSFDEETLKDIRLRLKNINPKVFKYINTLINSLVKVNKK